MRSERSMDGNSFGGFAAAEELSGTFASPPPRSSLSAQFWGVDLLRALPRTMTSDGVQAVPGDIVRIREFLAQSFPRLTEEAHKGAANAVSMDAKRRYLQLGCDLIELIFEGRTVGVLVGAPEDWGSYYVRIFAMLPSFQRPALIRRFGRECLFAPLAECGVQRVVADTSPANLAMARCFSELHFHVTGHQLSDRWGPLVRYTKFLDPACERVFLDRFGGTASPASAGIREEETP
jgi:RimJ/RimL family protein N-acetyltransferase